MKNQKYWNDRSVYLNEKMLSIGDRYYESLASGYVLAVSRIEKEINAFYRRFAKENKISPAIAKSILTSSERKKFMLDINEYIKKGKTLNYSKRWAKVLENASTSYRVTRLQYLQLQMIQQVEELYTKYNIGVSSTMESIFKESYSLNLKEFTPDNAFSTLDTLKIKNVIVKPWTKDGINFSNRVWKDKEKLIDYLEKELGQSFIRGTSPDKLIRDLIKRFGVSSYNAARLIQTESAYFSAMGKLESYKRAGFKKCIIIAVIDKKTSEVCRDMDGKIVDLNNFKPGITVNPFHPNCRTTTAPYAEH